MDLRRPIVVLLAVFLLLGGAAVAADNLISVEGDIPISSGESPLITLQTEDIDDLPINDFFDGNTTHIQTPDGDIRISGDPGANATIAASNIEGDQTELTEIDAGADWLELDPADKQRVDIRGDVDAFAFSNVSVNDGETDMQLTGTDGGTVEMRIHDLEPDETYVVFDGRALGTLDADSSGTAQGDIEMDADSHAIQIRTIDDLPLELSEPEPEGQITERPESLSVNATTDATPAEVVFEFDGEEVGTETVDESGRVSTDFDGATLGSFEWEATITDDLGRTETITVEYETPDEIDFREEHEPSQTITDADLELRFFSASGDIAISREPDEDGVVDMEGLPDSQFVVFASGPDHYDRTIFIDSIFEQDTMFLLNESEVPRDDNSALRSRFIYEDLTGNFPQSDTTIQIQRAVDVDGDGESEYRTIAGDFWGASGEFEQIFERGQRYRLVLVNQETGQENIAGTHIPTEELSQEVRISGVIEEAEAGSGVTPIAQINDGGLDIAYSDPADETEELNVRIESQSGDEVLLDETVDGPMGTYSTRIELNESQLEKDWIAEFDAGDRHRSAVPIGSGAVTLPISMPAWLLTFLGTLAVTFVGALYGPRTALLGSWSMVFVAAGLSMFGWAFSASSVLAAGLVAAGVTFVDRIRP